MDKDTSRNDPKESNETNPSQLAAKSSVPNDDDGFVVVEAADEGHHDLVGLPAKSNPEDDLVVQSTTALMDESANLGSTDGSDSSSTAAPLSLGDQPIGESAPVLPTDQVQAPLTKSHSNIKHLTPSEVKSIREELYTADSAKAPSTQERPEAVTNRYEPPADHSRPGNDKQAPVASAKPAETVPLNDLTRNEPIKRRGVAHFYKNYIQLPSGQTLRESDELTVRGRHFVLRRKAISPKLVLAVAAPVFAVLMILAVNIFVGGDVGHGKVVGLVVDDFGLPYQGQAIVRFPELGKAYRTDVMGFFETDQLPSGSHRIEYMVDGAAVGSDFCTVLSDQLNKVLLSPSEPENDKARAEVSLAAKVAPKTAPGQVTEKTTAQTAPAKKTSPKKKATSSSKAKLLLDANIENATLAIDGKTVGVGNMTYTRLKAGSRSYTVSRDGFESASGKVKLTSGKSTTLEVNLTPLTAAAKAEVYSADDYFFAARSMAQAGDDQSAIADFSRAIEINPGYSEAYQLRGDAFMRTYQSPEAFADYLRAGEIYQIHGSYTRAASAFTKAMGVDEKAIEPVLGRANSYLSRGENIAALTDFETAIDIDKKNPSAHAGLGLARFKHGQYKRAIKSFKKARDLNPSDASNHQYLMLAYLANNEVKNVKKTYNKFLAVATEKQFQDFQANKRYAAIIRLIDMGNR